MFILDYPIKAICGGFAYCLFALLNAKLVTDINIEVIAHSMKAIYGNVHMMPPRTLSFCRYFVVVGIVEVVIQPVVEALF